MTSISSTAVYHITAGQPVRNMRERHTRSQRRETLSVFQQQKCLLEAGGVNSHQDHIA